MQNLTFTLWMLLYPLACAASSYVYEVKLGRQYAASDRVLSAFFDLVIWLGVGCLLYGT